MALTKLNSASVIERLPVGSVLQLVKFESSTEQVISQTSYTDVNAWTGSITPNLANSIIRIEGHGAGLIRGAGLDLALNVLRGSTSIIETSRFLFTESGGTWGDANYTFIGYDSSHNSTSSLTYKIQMKCSDVTNKELRIGSKTSSGSSGYINFSLMEIKG